MSVYLDASFIVPLFANQEPLSRRAAVFLGDCLPELVISDFSGAEFASAIARLTRMNALTTDQAEAIFADFDIWTRRATTNIETIGADIRAAAAYLRQLRLNLRAPDALNIAVAQRVGATLATFDDRMAENAVRLGVEVAAV
ncbi:MAG TPA: type II toxin-antitoxin system VapC family toxin [Acetobacteraceae bacterium]|nr:type II toxin-antitoxin system VapC family toxin [Acetobacteraceae bacterium]